MIKQIPSVFLALMLFWFSLFVSWLSLSSVNFMYPWLYDVMSLDASIEEFGPQNLYKKDFHLTSDEERFRLFEEIVIAINHQGNGLEEIRYHNAQGEVLDYLLRDPEVVHLQDVANLIDRLRYFSFAVCLAIAITLVVLNISKRPRVFSTLKMFVVTLVSCVAAVVGVLIYGAEKIFYQWHTLVFPEGHQWFFYYQESLMTTMMRAPDLFGGIAILLGVVGLCCFFVCLKLVELLFRYRYRRDT